MDELVQRLSSGIHPVIAGGNEPSAKDLESRIEEFGYVHVKFTGTRGGTELGVRLDTDACDFSAADWDEPSGLVHLEGTLNLNYDPVRCIADIDLATLSGTGRLVPLDETVSAS